MKRCEATCERTGEALWDWSDMSVGARGYCGDCTMTTTEPPKPVREGWSFDIDKLWMHLAWMLPKRLCYWCAVRVGVYATKGQYSRDIVPELRMMEALDRWPK